jgi:hypothetical protein
MATADEIYSEHAVDLVRFATVLVGRDDANDVVFRPLSFASSTADFME